MVAGVWTRVRFWNLKNFRTCTQIQNFWNKSGVEVWKSDSGHLWFTAVLQCWTWSGFRIAIQTDSAIQNRNRVGLDFEKTQPDRIWISKLHWSLQHNAYSEFFFGYKPDWIKYLDRSTGFGSDRITQWKFWTGLGLQKSPICSTLRY